MTELSQLERLFHAAAELPLDKRTDYLERECTDASVRSRVEAMLEQLERDQTLATPLTEGPGTVIDRYKLLQRIGEGGFGVVYMAEQLAPVRRKVALKIIKLGMDTKEVVARFEAERQALALMDHPNIARVLDGGATDTGRPYFVMELVRGIAITEYCDQNNLSTTERLQLFVAVCQAVQHAHQKGVIHRDIKPTNVLVTLHDGVPMPKVIDFGIAKAMHTRLTEKTLFTEFQRFVGTPAYMSPEQAEMSALDVDTRTDIYSLGVLLYELLTGTTPFDTRTLARAGLAEIQRVLREDQPPRPSLRISTSGTAAIASHRGADVPTLSKRVRGELDWIVMKALEKERTRRYSTASELGADVLRHLDKQPVQAGPPSAIYRSRKFLARNRVAVTFVTLLTLALVGGIIGTTTGMLRAKRSAADAQALRIEAEESAHSEALARAEAQDEAQRASLVTSFLVDTLAITNPKVALQPDVSVRTLLDDAASRVEAALAGQPRAEIPVRWTIGKAYASLSEPTLAERHLRRAVQLVDELDDYDKGEFYRILWALTGVCFTNEAPDAYAMARRARQVGHAHIRESRPELADVLDRFISATDQADLEGALAAFPESVRVSEELLPHGHPDWLIVAETNMHAGYSLWYTPYEHITERFWERALAIFQRELPPNHPNVAEVLNQLVGVLNRSGQLVRAESRIRESLDMLRLTHTEQGFAYAQAEAMLGENLLQQERYEEAEQHLLDSHRVILETLPDKSTFYAIDSYGRVLRLYDSWDRQEQASVYREQLNQRCVEAQWIMPWPIARSVLPPEKTDMLEWLDQCDALCGSPYESPVFPRPPPDDESVLPVAEGAARVLATISHDDPLSAVLGRHMVGWSAADTMAEAPEARRVLAASALEALQPWSEQLPLDTAEALARLATYEEDPLRARSMATEAWRMVRRSDREDNWYRAMMKQRVGACFMQLELYDWAETLLLRGHEALLASMGEEHAFTKQSRQRLVALYTAKGEPERAAEYAVAEPAVP